MNTVFENLDKQTVNQITRWILSKSYDIANDVKENRLYELDVMKIAEIMTQLTIAMLDNQINYNVNSNLVTRSEFKDSLLKHFKKKL